MSQTGSIIPVNYIPKNRTVEITLGTSFYEIRYYKGEVNEQGQPDGAGLMIYLYGPIYEAYWKNGYIWGEVKIIDRMEGG